MNNYLSKAKESAQFMNSFLAAVSYHRKLEECKGCISSYSRLPILFDATCSGMQHLSGLTGDLQLATYVNIISNDEPEDSYLWCAQAVEKSVESYKGDDKVKSLLSKIKLDRSIVKKSVMTIPYNIKLEGMSHQITDHFTKHFVDIINPLAVPSTEDGGMLAEGESVSLNPFFLSIVAILVSVISASYYLKIVRVIHFDPAYSDTTSSTSPAQKLTSVHSKAIATLTMAIALFAVYPELILNSTTLLALSLYGY